MKLTAIEVLMDTPLSMCSHYKIGVRLEIFHRLEEQIRTRKAVLTEKNATMTTTPVLFVVDSPRHISDREKQAIELYRG